MKATAKAPANIAFIKYWGKRNESLRIPMNSSISMNLSEVFTTTSVEFSKEYIDDALVINGNTVDGKEKERVSEFLDRIRKISKVKLNAKVVSKNNFPKGTGMASSASGFAALTLATTKALGLNLSEKELSILARLGSGSACRSIPDGIVEWKSGKQSNFSYAYSLYPPDYWDIQDVILIIGEKDKKISSTEGHALVESSPFYKSRIAKMDTKIRDIKKALKEKDFTKFGQIIEEEAVNMHAVMMTSKPGLFYWLPETLKFMLLVQNWRDNGVESYFTIDAGPNIHIICEGKSVNKLMKKIKELKGIKNAIVNKPSIGARLID